MVLLGHGMTDRPQGYFINTVLPELEYPFVLGFIFPGRGGGDLPFGGRAIIMIFKHGWEGMERGACYHCHQIKWSVRYDDS